MSVRSGIAAQFGFKKESTYGTAVAVDTFLPLISESMKAQETFTESEGILAGRHMMTSDQWNSGSIEVGGSSATELYDSDVKDLFELMLGSISGAGPYTATPGDLYGLSATVQIGRPDVGGVVRPFTYAGAKVASWEIGCSLGETVKLGIDWLAQSEDISASGAAALQTAAYTSGLKPFKFTGATVNFNGGSAKVRQMTLSGDNALSDRRFLGQQTTDEPVETDLRKYNGALQFEFEDLNEYNLYLAHTEVAIVATFAANSKSIAITTNARLDGETPNVGGRGIVEQQVPFTMLASGADSTAISVVITE